MSSGQTFCSRARMAIICALLFAPMLLCAYPGKHLHLEQLVQSSDVIAAVDIANIRSVGRSDVVVDGNRVNAIFYKADVRLNRQIKGSCPEQFTIEFYTPLQYVGYPGIDEGHQMVFLKNLQQQLVFTDLHFPSFPALPGSSLPSDLVSGESDPFHTVLAEMGAVIASPSESLNDKQVILLVSYALPSVDSFMSSLRAAEKTAADLDFKYRIQGELMSRGDLSPLPSVKLLLLQNALADKQKEILLFVIANRINNSRAVPHLKDLLQAGDLPTRRAAAEALWHIADPSSHSILVNALNDRDREVRYYATRALADSTGQREWGPAPGEFDDHEQKYVDHWRRWALAKGIEQAH